MKSLYNDVRMPRCVTRLLNRAPRLGISRKSSTTVNAYIFRHVNGRIDGDSRTLEVVLVVTSRPIAKRYAAIMSWHCGIYHDLYFLDRIRFHTHGNGTDR